MKKRIILLLILAGCSATSIFRITPVRPVDELICEALQEKPPVEHGSFYESDLVEVIKLDSTILTDIRYATEDNFLSTPLYSQSRAFLQRPAALALVRANKKLKEFGLGILIHDAYRPWYVTKVFWDATPEELHDFVANPARGSKHNRGCAVDVTLYSVSSGEPLVMPSLYDEMSERAHADYQGGSSEEREMRDLLRRAMEAEGFTVYSNEWWHFDYKDWKSYSIQNIRFEDIYEK